MLLGFHTQTSFPFKEKNLFWGVVKNPLVASPWYNRNSISFNNLEYKILLEEGRKFFML